MTADERRIANAALGAGPWDDHDQIVIAVADGLGLEAQHEEAVLQRLRIRMVIDGLCQRGERNERNRFRPVPAGDRL
jgi:hypothetical protein